MTVVAVNNAGLMFFMASRAFNSRTIVSASMGIRFSLNFVLNQLTQVLITSMAGLTRSIVRFKKFVPFYGIFFCMALSDDAASFAAQKLRLLILLNKQ